jgi:TPR repeat protein
VQDVVPYPYDAYLLKDSKDRPVPAGQEWRKAKGSKNPDLQYAYALRWLYGDECNPSRAIDLLEEAAKDNHVLADYELGVCYYRGYGVAPNEKKADRYLKEAETFGYSKASALRSMIAWVQHNRPKFYDRKSWNDSMAEMIEASGKSIEHDNSVFYSFFSDVQDYYIFEYSPKRFHLGFWTQHRYLFINFPDADEIVGRHMEQNRNAGYIPAYLTEAQYLEFRKKDRKAIIRLLRAGSKAGDLECRSKLMLVLAEAGEPPKEMFNAENDLLLSDDPVYLLLDYALKHPDEPGISEFLAADHKGAERIWERKNSAESGYLSALLTWSQVYPYRHRHGVPHRRKKVEDSAEVEQVAAMRRDEEKAAATGFEQLKTAAKAGIPSAMYLVARQYGNCDYPADDEVTSDTLAKLASEAWMKKAAAAGHARARFQMLRWESEKAMVGRLEQMLPEVEEFCRINYPPAFLLKAEILDRLNRNAEAVAAYEAAASRGEYQAWRILALKQEKLKKENAANELWKKFIAADREHRRQDRYDVFYPQIKIDIKLQPWMMSPEEIQEYRTRLEKTVNIEIVDD